jgi:hypothetical protein
MQVKFDKATKTVTVTFEYDPAKEYAVNEKTGKSRTIDGTGGFIVFDGARGAKVNVVAILPVK